MKQKKFTLTKKMGIAIFTVAMLIMAAVIVFYNNPMENPGQAMAKKGVIAVVLLLSTVVFAKFYDKFMALPTELYQNRHLIWKLAKNDFKNRYAGSYMGAVWALVQPVVTIVMYYVVFDVIMGVGRPTSNPDVPYVLFLTAGLVPWFYFNEAVMNGSNSMLEYNYLVKKVVFKISILPIIKIIAATFIHVFFVCVLLIIAALYGFYPSIYTIQLIYYSFCMFVLVLGMCYTTCAVMVFFRDLGQIISIILQIGMWATPILWDIGTISPKAQLLVKVNPVAYIVGGYRSAIIDKVWFFEDFYYTIYFWMFTIVIFGIGALIFKRLKVHFADVL